MMDQTAKRVAFVGSKALGLSVVHAVHQVDPASLCGIVTIDDTQDTRCALEGFRGFSSKTGKPLVVLSKAGQLGAAVASLEPDLCLVVGWYWLLRKELLEKVPDGWLGIHASLLPKYRGGAPLVWALINGERITGVSLFYLDEGMDTGDIVMQVPIAVGPYDTIADALERANAASVQMIREVYLLVLRGTAPRLPQDESAATYAAVRQPVDGRIDWNRAAIELHNFIRAQTHPYPGAFCLAPSGRVMRVWSAEPFPRPFSGTAGKVVMREDRHVVVACSSGTALQVLTVQLEGDAERPAQEVLRLGERLT